MVWLRMRRWHSRLQSKQKQVEKGFFQSSLVTGLPVATQTTQNLCSECPLKDSPITSLAQPTKYALGGRPKKKGLTSNGPGPNLTKSPKAFCDPLSPRALEKDRKCKRIEGKGEETAAK